MYDSIHMYDFVQNCNYKRKTTHEAFKKVQKVGRVSIALLLEVM